VTASSSTIEKLGGSSGLYDGNGGEGCPCATAPPAASFTGVALDPAGNGSVLGQLTPGGNLEAAAYVVATPPPAPTDVRAKAGAASVTLRWKSPTSDGGTAVTGYDVYKATRAGAEGAKPVNSRPLGEATHLLAVTGLKNGTRYYFVVKAINAAGVGTASAEVSATPATVPGAPANVKASGGAREVTVKWTVPASDGGSAVTGYDVYEGTKAGREGTTPVNAKPLAAAKRTFAATGLKKGTKYFFVVKAINTVGIGKASAEVSATPS